MNAPILLDTHALLWLLADDKRLPRSARRILADPDADLVVSAASVWEIVLKCQAGKLKLDVPLKDFVSAIVSEKSWRLLPITVGHMAALCGLPLLHKDPFGRILAVQAKLEDMILLTMDAAIAKYDVRTAW